jgi:creatinine amidohydrolase/Fe(II)-dependent formamide hydrolase-like protein
LAGLLQFADKKSLIHRLIHAGKLNNGCESGLIVNYSIQLEWINDIDPEHVQMENAVRETLNHTSPEVSWDYGAVNRFFWPEKFKRMTKSGVIGDPTLGTVEKGEFILQVMRDQANFKMESGAGSKVVNHACRGASLFCRQG